MHLHSLEMCDKRTAAAAAVLGRGVSLRATMRASRGFKFNTRRERAHASVREQAEASCGLLPG